MNVELKVIGQPINRVDGPRKVTGEARYAAEFDLPDLLHGALVLSTVPAGTIAAIDAEAARRAPGVYAVITHENAPRLPYKPYGKRPQVDAQSGDQLQVFQDARIHFNGQPSPWWWRRPSNRRPTRRTSCGSPTTRRRA